MVIEIVAVVAVVVTQLVVIVVCRSRQWCRGAMFISVQTHDTRVVSLSPTRVTIKTPLERKAMGNHLIKSTSLEKALSTVSGFCYA